MLASACALAQAPPLTERDALEAGERALRERRWDDAIAAFAEAHKAWPAAEFEEAHHDPRSRIVTQAVDEILAELDRAGASPAEKLPYWEFYVEGFPFFSTSLNALDTPSALQARALSAAEERRRQADPEAKMDRFAPRRALEAALSDPSAVLALLEGDWPVPHDDWDLCALRALECLKDAAKGAGWDCVRTWKCCKNRFSYSPWMAYFDVRVYDAEKDDMEPPPATTNPRARRWWLIHLIGSHSLSDPDQIERVESLGQAAGPWISPGLTQAWAIGAYANPDENKEEYQRQCSLRLKRMVEDPSAPPEIGLARYNLLWQVARGRWDEIDLWIGDYVSDWREDDPEDPWLAWADYQVAAHHRGTWPVRPLPEADRRRLEAALAMFAGEAITPYAQCLLADDDLLYGRGEEALRRYRLVATFDAGSVSLHGPEHADGAIAWARGRLQTWTEHREPLKLGPFLEPVDQRFGPFQEFGFCGNAFEGYGATQQRKTARLWRLAGRPDEGLKGYEKAFRSEWNAFDYMAVDYAALCLALGREDRIGERIGELEKRDSAAKAAASPGTTPTDYQGAATALRGFLADRARIEKEGIPGALAILEEDIALHGSESIFDQRGPHRIRGVLAILRASGCVDEKAAHLWAAPPTPASIAIAAISHGEASLDFLIDATLTRPKDAQSLWEYSGRTYGGALAQRGEEVVKRILERIAADGMQRWDSYASILQRLPDGDVWRACAAALKDSDPVVQDLARMEMARVRRKDPWLAYCLGEK